MSKGVELPVNNAVDRTGFSVIGYPQSEESIFFLVSNFHERVPRCVNFRGSFPGSIFLIYEALVQLSSSQTRQIFRGQL